MSLNGTAPNPDSLEARVATLEASLALLSWLHAELMYALRLAAATQYAQAMGPQVQQQMVEKIMSEVT